MSLMINDYLNKLSDYFVGKNIFRSSDTILLGLSGGPDSVFLYYLLISIKNKTGLNLNLIHINHKLRSQDSDLDEDFVRKLADEYGNPLSVYCADIKSISEQTKVSIEMCARKVRYDYFKKEAEKINASYIATAHTADDKIETALLRIIYGCGIEGLTCLKFKRKMDGRILIRPIINCWKKDILAYLENKNIPFRIDKSNFSNEFIRNRIRNFLIPEIEKSFNSSFKNTFLNSLKLISQQSKIIKKSLNVLKDNILIRNDFIHVYLKKDVQILNKYEITQLLIDSMYELSKSPIRFSLNQFNSFVGNFSTVETVQFKFPQKISVYSDSNYIFVSEDKVFERFFEPDSFVEELKIDSKLKIDSAIKIEIQTQSVKHSQCLSVNQSDLWKDLISGKDVFFNIIFLINPVETRLFVRNRRDGDRIKLQSGTKKIKKLFIDEHIPSILRNTLPLICNQDGKVLWVPGVKQAIIDCGGEDELKVTVHLKI